MLYITRPDRLHQVKIWTLRQIFKNTAFDLVKYNKIFEDVNNEKRQKDTIKNYHNGLNNDRGVNETKWKESTLKNT